MVPLNEDDTPSACPLAEGSTLTAPDSERVRNFLEAKGIQQSDLVYWWQMGWRKAWKASQSGNFSLNWDAMPFRAI